VVAALLALQDNVDSSDNASMTSEAMQQSLRMYGLFSFTALLPTQWTCHVLMAFLAIACNELHQMQEEANHDNVPAPVAIRRC